MCVCAFVCVYVYVYENYIIKKENYSLKPTFF